VTPPGAFKRGYTVYANSFIGEQMMNIKNWEVMFIVVWRRRLTVGTSGAPRRRRRCSTCPPSRSRPALSKARTIIMCVTGNPALSRKWQLTYSLGGLLDFWSNLSQKLVKTKNSVFTAYFLVVTWNTHILCLAQALKTTDTIHQGLYCRVG